MSQIDIGRGALVLTLIEEYGFEANLAAKAALAAHPLDDNPVPSRAFEKQVRKVSRQYGKVLRSLRGKPQEAEVLTLKTLQSYKDLAIQHGEGHYINRYDKALKNEPLKNEPPTSSPQIQPVEKETSAEEHMRNFAECLSLTVNDVQTLYSRSLFAVFEVVLDDLGYYTIEGSSIPSLPESPITFVYKEAGREVRQLTPQKAMRMMQKAAKGL